MAFLEQSISAFCENIARNVMKNGRKTSRGVDLHQRLTFANSNVCLKVAVRAFG